MVISITYIEYDLHSTYLNCLGGLYCSRDHSLISFARTKTRKWGGRVWRDLKLNVNVLPETWRAPAGFAAPHILQWHIMFSVRLSKNTLNSICMHFWMCKLTGWCVQRVVYVVGHPGSKAPVVGAVLQEITVKRSFHHCINMTHMAAVLEKRDIWPATSKPNVYQLECINVFLCTVLFVFKHLFTHCINVCNQGTVASV